ncbi:MAG: dTMP kinase [Firmicutes bacterium]|nr:dTMP kinase [Bacillota bacterium]
MPTYKNFITFEGCEGVGKSVQIRLLKEYLDKQNIVSVVTREPGGTEISEQIRKVILDAKNTKMCDECETMLYFAARTQLLNDIIVPALKDNKLTICDRYIDSTYAYQGAGKGLGKEYIDKLANLIDVFPGLTIFLDLKPKDAFIRKGGKDTGDRLENLSLDFHEKVYSAYKQMERENKERFIAINAYGEIMETHAKIIDLLKLKGVIK